MLKGNFQEIVLQVLNIGFGAGSLALMARGFFVFDGLAGLGLALFMTSLISFVAFRYGIEQEIKQREPKQLSLPVSLQIGIAS